MTDGCALSQREKARLDKMCAIEREYWAADRCVAGMDEAGRGPLAGPVTAACVCLPPTPLLEGVNDSKRVGEARREKLFDAITQTALAYGIGWASEEEIQQINILQATKLACERAYAQMAKIPDILLTDALSGLRVPVEQRAIVHGDALSYSIAAASLLAKVSRDRYMREMDRRFPGYGFMANKGYGTAQHIEALRRLGPCGIHRPLFIRKFISM